MLHGTGPESSVFSLWGCRGLGCLQCDDSEFFFCTVAGLWNRIPALVRLANSLFGVILLFGQAGGRPHRYADFEWPLCGSVFGVKHEATCAGGPRWSKSSTRTMVSCLQHGQRSGVHPSFSAEAIFHSFFSLPWCCSPNASLQANIESAVQWQQYAGRSW